MKQKCKQLTALVLALAMCLSLLSTTAWAADLSAEAASTAEEVQETPEPAADEADNEEEAAETEEAEEETPAEEEEQETAADEGDVIVSASSVATETCTYVNPLYADAVTEDDLAQPSEDEGDVTVSAASTTSVSSVEAAAEYVREEMKNRSETITFSYDCDSILDSSVMNEIFELALEHTGDPEEGDYLLYQYGGMHGGLQTNVYTEETTSGGETEVKIVGYSNVITYTVTYYTDADQEAEVTAKLAEVLEELDLDGMSDYDKLAAIYDYICSNVEYDYESLSDSDEVVEYTAYGALVSGKAVCQGFAVLLYRMALEAGIDARIVSGTGTNSAGTTKAHAWDIVKLGSCYYNVDATWDEAYKAAGQDYRYFLLCESNFSVNHDRGDEYTTDAFYAAYPMATSDYTTADFTVTLSETSYTYDGTAKEPDVIVTDEEDKLLTEGTDYTVACDEAVNAGSYTVTVTGMGDYNGSITETFTIDPANISSYTVTVASATYTGKALSPAVTVKDADGNTLTSGTDYTVAYSNNTNAGTATVTVTGTGNYTDTATGKFTINKASQTVTASVSSSSIYAGNTTTVTGKGTGTISYSSSDTSVASVTSAGKVTGKKPGTVTITVKAAGNSNYNSATKTVKITVSLNKTTISSLTNTSKGITVKWSKVTGASGYYIYRNGSKVKTVTSGSTVSYTDTGAKTNGTKYQYKIYAYYGSTKSAVSSTKTTYYVSGVSISSLKNSSSKKMTAKWGKNTKATGYQIQYSTSSSFASGNKTVTVSSYKTVSKTISSLTKGKTYYVRIRAYKTVSGTKYYSAWSGIKKVKISK